MNFDLDLSTEYDVINCNKTKSSKHNNFITQNQRFSTSYITLIQQNGFQGDFDFFTNDHWVLCLV